MIKNERQYRVSTTQRDRLATEMAVVDEQDAPAWVLAASKAALASQISDIEGELADYEALLAANVEFSVPDIASLPRELIRARIARRMSQRDLAVALGLQEQQIQRYEATEYASASVARLTDIMDALDVHLAGELHVPGDGDEHDLVRRALAGIGLSPATIKNRFFAAASVNVGNWMSAATRASRIYGSTLDDVLTGSIPELAASGAFRAVPTANRDRLSGYAKYAEYLAEIALKACTTPFTPLPPFDELREMLGEELSADPLGALLRTCWQHGIPVVPMTDSGSFFGACWFFNDRPAIVLKNNVRSAERWSTLLAHEMDHARHPEEASILESGLDVAEWHDQPTEQRADSNATQLLLGDRGEAMAMVAVERAGHSTSRLKAAVIEVAEAEEVSVGILADYVAHRVSAPGVNWWATANNLHRTEVDAWLVTRSELFSNVNFEMLDRLDRDILIDGMAP